jgi:hypothetical protein
MVSVAPIHIIVPVWGETYTRCFLDVGLPSLLATGNFPSLPREHGHLCHIITTGADRATIEKSSAFGALAALIDIRFDDIGANPEISDDRHKWQSYCNRVGIAAADERGAAMIFLNPDVVIADGGIQALSALLARGKRAVQVLAVRMVKEAAVPALTKGYATPDRTRLTISPRQLMRLALDNLHPLSMLHMYEKPDLDLSPSGLFWAAAQEGLVCRCVHLHPMLVHPRIRNAPFSTTIDDDYLRAACPDVADEYIVADSDEFCACELSGLERAGPGLPRGQIDDSVASWMAAAAKPQHFENLARRIFLRAERNDDQVWRDACWHSDEAVHRIFHRIMDMKARLAAES